MSSTVLQITLEVGGALVDPDALPGGSAPSMVFSDPTRTSTVIRTDTGATVPGVPSITTMANPISGGDPIVTGPAFTRITKGVYQYVLTDPAPDLTYSYWVHYSYQGIPYWQEYSKAGTASGAGAATSEFADESDLIQYIGSLNLQIISSQDNNATSNNHAFIQLAFDGSDAHIYQMLNRNTCKAGPFFVNPFTVGGAPVKTSTSTMARPTLKRISCQYATFLLNNWRMIISTPDGTGSSVGEVSLKCLKAADDDLNAISRWVQGYTDDRSMAIDLDLSPGAVVGQGYKQVTAPAFLETASNPNCLPSIVSCTGSMALHL